MKKNVKGGSDRVYLDRLDLKILAALHDRGRITKVDLSEAVGLSPTPCCVRIARLEDEGFIRGYHADVDLERVAGLSRFIVTVSIKEYTPEKARQFEEIVAGIPFIVECDAVFGSIDYVLQIVATSTTHYHEIVTPMLAMEIDYTTYPISRGIRKSTDVELRQLLEPSSAHSNGQAARKDRSIAG